LMLKLSPTVLIEGKQAAVQGSQSQNIPPHIPCGPGPFQKPPSNLGEVMLGSPNVQIDDGSGGGGGGGGGGGAAEASTADTQVEGHKLDVQVTDKGGFPLTGVHYSIKGPDGTVTSDTLTGHIKRGVPESGNYEIMLQAITRAKWSAKKAREGEKVKLQVETTGVESGTKAELVVWQKDLNRPDMPVADFSDAKVDGDKVEAEWTYKYQPEAQAETSESPASFSSPKFYFTVKIGELSSRSEVLDYKDYIELRLRNSKGDAIGNARYVLHLPNGQLREGKLDGNGYAKETKIPPGRVQVKFPDHGSVSRT
jgi:hypothetical protein